MLKTQPLRAIFVAALLVLMPLVFYFTTEGTWNLLKQRDDGGWSGGFFWAQAEALVHGRLDVPREAIRSECWDRDGRCYGYFGLTPSVIRIPFLGILRWQHSSFTPVFLSAGILLAYWTALRGLRRALTASSSTRPGATMIGCAVIGALALGPGSTLIFLTRPAVYEEATAWGIAFFLLAVDRVWEWHASGTRRHLWLAAVFGILAANARPTAATACGAIGLTAFVLARAAADSATRARARTLIAALCVAVLPALTASGVFWLKFRMPIPDLRLNEQVPEAPHWRDILAKNGDRTGGLIFTPTELAAYFRPDAVIRRRVWPIVDFRFPREQILWVPPLPQGGAYVERFTSVTAAMPLPWIVNVLAVAGLAASGVGAWRQRRAASRPRDTAGASFANRADWILAAGSLVSAAAMAMLTITTVGITNRYLNDFFAISVVGFGLSARLFVPWLSRRPVLAGVAGIVSLAAVAWSIVVVTALNTRLIFH